MCRLVHQHRCQLDGVLAVAAAVQDCWAPVPEQRPGFDVVVSRLQDLLQQLKHAEVTATAAAAANRTAAAITAAATGGAMHTSQ